MCVTAALAQKTQVSPVPLLEGQHKAALGLAQGLHLKQVLQKGFWCPVKGLRNMEVPSSSNQKGRNRVPKPSWADMVEGKHKDVDKEKEAPKTKDEPMEEKEEEEWWTKDWKSSSMSWNDWWQKKEDEWQEWQAWKRWEEEQEEEDAKEKDAKLAATKTEEEKEEKSVLQGKGARWTNRPGSQKEKGRMKL